MSVDQRDLLDTLRRIAELAPTARPASRYLETASVLLDVATGLARAALERAGER